MAPASSLVESLVLVLGAGAGGCEGLSWCGTTAEAGSVDAAAMTPLVKMNARRVAIDVSAEVIAHAPFLRESGESLHG